MSSPSPDHQKVVEHTYQSSETSDHGLLAHPHPCQCNDKPLEAPKTETLHHTHCHSGNNKQTHHHNIISLTHVPPNSTSHIHPINQSVHVHVHASPKMEHTPNKMISCTCHLQDEILSDAITESGDSNNLMMTGGRKLEADDRIEVSPLPPALPPRPPPRPRIDGSLNSRHRPRNSNPNHGGIRKYVFWCCVCGGLATILGASFLAVYFMLRSYTSTLGYFETIPTFVPATMLMLTGLCVISLARRKNRYSYLIKVCGLCCLVCALTCVLVTITTTVIHMNRLQTLRECVYTQKTRTCTCYSVPLEAHTDDSMRFIFDSTPDCEVIHGALYTCLRMMFGLSVSGILVCIFSCMLVYQLLSHEKKKMYWEQLELRCRSFYQQHTGGPSTHGSMRGPPITPSTYCSCCEECRYPPIPLGPQVYPWDSHHSTDRFWTPGRVGNFYSPNPGEDGPIADGVNRERSTTTGWNWRRLPWTRNSQSDTQRDDSLTYQVGVSSADSQYGFSNNRSGDNLTHGDGNTGSTGSYSILDNTRPPIGGVYVWGPPPPYSNPNSPARRPLQHHQSPGRFHNHHHLHTHESHCQMANTVEDCRNSRRMLRHLHANNKDNYENTGEIENHTGSQMVDGESTDSDRVVPHTLPARKIKKKIDTTKSEDCDESTSSSTTATNTKKGDCIRFLPRLQGVENAAFQNQETVSQQTKPETSESEVYFADVSSCCNISVRNDGQDSSLYDEALETRKNESSKDASNNQLIQNFQEAISSSTVTEDEDYLAHRMGNRQMSVRSRLPFPLPPSGDEEVDGASDDFDHLRHLPKDVSQNSLCSSAQSPLTETTDDAITPSADIASYFPDRKSASFDHFLAPDAQYEVIQEHQTSSNLTNTISGLNNYYDYNNAEGAPKNCEGFNSGGARRNLGSNISALIQNLGGNPAGLLYGEAGCGDDEEAHGHGCHSDGTMDSGWHSGSEKTEMKTSPDNSDPVNV